MMTVSVVISSCDLYSDCWKPMFLSLKENWPESRIPVYLISNYKQSGDTMVKTIIVGEHLGWGINTHKALESIDSEYILLLQEDYFLNKSLQDGIIEKHVRFCKENDVDYLRLGEPFVDQNMTENPDYCNNPIDLPYALCLQPAIWKKSTLLKLTLDGWTGWDFERNIKSYIDEHGILIKAMVINSCVAPTQGYNMVHGTAIRKGIWTEGGIEFLQSHGFYEEIKGRKREGKLLTILNDVQPSSPFIWPAKVLRKTIQTIKRKW